MSTAIQRRGRPGLATLIEKFPLILFLALLVWLSVQSPYSLSWQNISLMLVQSVPLAILCFGLVRVIAVGGDDVVSGGIDLSLPATAVLGVALLSLGLAEWHTPYLLLAGAAGGGLPAVRGDQRFAGAGGRPAAAAGHPLDLGGVYRSDRSVDRPATHCGQRSADGRLSRQQRAGPALAAGLPAGGVYPVPVPAPPLPLRPACAGGGRQSRYGADERPERAPLDPAGLAVSGHCRRLAILPLLSQGSGSSSGTATPLLLETVLATFIGAALSRRRVVTSSKVRCWGNSVNALSNGLGLLGSISSGWAPLKAA